MSRWAQAGCYQLSVQHACAQVTNSQCGLPGFYQDVRLSFTCSAKHELVTHFLCLPQIKEAADIIQKLHLIAQELPFDRWVASLWHETRAQSNRGKVSLLTTKSFPPTDLLMSRQKLQVRKWIKLLSAVVYILKCRYYAIIAINNPVCRSVQVSTMTWSGS